MKVSQSPRIAELEALSAIANIGTQTGAFELKVTQAIEVLVEVTQSHKGIFRAIERDQGILRLIASSGQGLINGPQVSEEIRIDGRTLSGDALQGDQTIVINDYVLSPIARQYGAFPEVGSAIAIPVKIGNESCGVITLMSRSPQHFTEERIKLIEVVTSSIGSMVDRSFAAQELLDSKERYENLVETIPHGVEEIDLQGKITFVNKAHQEMHGYAKDEIVGRQVWTMPATDEGRNRMREHLSKLFADNPTPFPYISTNSKKDGNLLDVQVDWNYKRDVSGQVTGIVSVVTDITDRKRVEEEVRRLALAVATANDGIIVAELDGKISFTNETAERVLGYGRHEMIGMEVSNLHAESARNIESRKIIDATMNAGHWAGEVLLQRKAGQEFPARLSTSLMRNRDEQPVGMVAIMTDLTERKQAEERMRESSRLIALGELSAMAAHELNNPLTAVLGFAQLLDGQDLDPSVKEDVRHILTAAHRAANVVRNMLSLARKHDMETVSMDIAEVIERVLTILEVDLKVNNIAVETDLASICLHGIGDPHRLEEVFLNIVTNAQQAMSGAQRMGRLLIRGTREDEFIRISVTDNGPGIEPGLLQNIFDPFFTTKGADQGTGLGLSICRSLVQQQKGRIWVESEVGKGSTVYVELPACESQ